MKKRKVVEGKSNDRSWDYVAVIAGDAVLLLMAAILKDPDVNSVGVAILSGQLFGYLLSVYLADRKKQHYLFISFLPLLLALCLIVLAFF